MNERQRRVNGIALALLVLAVASAWLIVDQRRERAGGGEPEGSALLHDMDRLWDWAGPQLQGGASAASWSVRWDGELTHAQLDALAQQLRMQPPAPGGKTAQALRQDASGTLRMWMTPAAGAADGGWAVLLYEGRAGQPLAVLHQAVDGIETVLKAEELDLRPYVTLRGEARSAEAAQTVAGKAGGELVESYDDGRTASMTYYSEQLRLRTQSGGNAVNLQLALRRGSAEAPDALIAGAPLITGDYTP
ncbi:YwmB family TATA-box binding protein [Paenibacillus sp. IB182496]|uniref:YwmB family TATA-box binding protein n=1 Tax=Paenibacillus sabuli TaxID=2772509 RepID=A0A927GSW8_9BACL|nr:YwmB family TATA-box binding protein [Paenibacillus sabuli]MBD2847199.1 YwmB family TATA-box binding protein [Paenibacillus sabuli]